MSTVMPNITVDVIGENCPIPLVEMRKAVMTAEKGSIIKVMGTDKPSKSEIPMAVNALGLKLLDVTVSHDGIWNIYIQK